MLTYVLDLVTEYRLLQVPILNWVIICLYLVNIFKMSLRFAEFHSKVALLAVLPTNLLLYGLADTLAQTIRNVASFKQSGPSVSMDDSRNRFRYIIDRGRSRQVLLDDYDDDLVELGLGYLAPSATPSAPVSHPEVFNFRRLALFSMWGVIISFFQTPWYAFLNSTWNGNLKFVSVLQRVLCDQLVYSPISLACFLIYMTVVMEKGDRSDVERKLMSAYLPTLGVNFCVWPLAQFLNFLVIPHSLQIPFSSTLSVFWNCYLSLTNPS